MNKQRYQKLQNNRALRNQQIHTLEAHRTRKGAFLSDDCKFAINNAIRRLRRL
jgi:hypothetical protein